MGQDFGFLKEIEWQLLIQGIFIEQLQCSIILEAKNIVIDEKA